MRSLFTSVICIAAMFATGFTVTQQNGAFDNVRPAVPVAPVAPTVNPFRRTVSPGDFGQVRNSFPSSRNNSEERSANQKITAATRMLKAEDAATRSRGKDQLQDAVGELFDIRTKSRRTQIESLEKRLADLRSQLEKREGKKSDIVRLHVQTLVNQANGLGF